MVAKRKVPSCVPTSNNNKNAANLDVERAAKNTTKLVKNEDNLIDGEKVFKEEYWRTCKYTLIVAGLWPYKKRSFNVFLRFFYIFIILTMMIPEMIRAYKELGKNPLIVLDCIIGSLYFQICIMKYITNFYSMDKLQYIYEHITENLKEYSDHDEQNILHTFAKHGHSLIVRYSACLYAGCFSYTTIRTTVPAFLDLVHPLNTSREKRLCNYVEYFIDEKSYFYYIFMHNFFCVFCSVVIFSAVDGSYVYIVQHSVALFKITAYRLNKVFETNENEIHVEQKELEKKIHDYVINSIVVHNKSIEFVNCLQTTYTTSFFLSTMATLVGLTLGIAILIISVKDVPTFMKVLVLVFGTVLNLFFISIPGQQILEASSNISYSIFSCGWYELPLKVQRLLKFMMLRCLEPCKFTAGPLWCLNLVTCYMVLKTATSYFTLVKHINDHAKSP